MLIRPMENRPFFWIRIMIRNAMITATASAIIVMSPVFIFFLPSVFSFSVPDYIQELRHHIAGLVSV